MTWLDHAACHGRWDLFDGIALGENTVNGRPCTRHQYALAICRECPVLWQCRTWALTQYEDDTAIVGGMTGPQRRAWRRTQGLNRPPEIRPYDWIDRTAIGQ